jgi:signal-transduction protein with cAMP-binding, CBS, and nucleotidyltransferase domain
MQVKDLATIPAVCCRATTSISDVARLMHETNVGSVVVVDDTTHPIGIATDRDLVTRALARELPPGTAVGHVMTKDLLLAQDDEPIERVLHRASGWACRRVPVVSASGAVIGMVTLDDLMQQLAETVSEITQAERAARHRA